MRRSDSQADGRDARGVARAGRPSRRSRSLRSASRAPAASRMCERGVHDLGADAVALGDRDGNCVRHVSSSNSVWNRAPRAGERGTLSSDADGSDPPEDAVRALADRLRAGSPRITVVTGAGVSAASGVPTFRGPGGLWRVAPARGARDARSLRARPAARVGVVRVAPASWWPKARPTAPTRCWRPGAGGIRRFTLVTQNVDGLHERAGTRERHALPRLALGAGVPGPLPGLGARRDGSTRRPSGARLRAARTAAASRAPACLVRRADPAPRRSARRPRRSTATFS